MTTTRDRRSKNKRAGPDEDGAFHITTKGGPAPGVKKRKLNNVHEPMERHFDTALLDLALNAHPKLEEMNRTINTLSGWGYSPHELKLASAHGTTSEELLSKLRHDRYARSWAEKWRYMPFATRKDVRQFFVQDVDHDSLTHIAARSNTSNEILFGYSKDMLDIYTPGTSYESRYDVLRAPERPIDAWPPPKLSEKERHNMENGIEFTSDEEGEELVDSKPEPAAEPEPAEPAASAEPDPAEPEPATEPANPAPAAAPPPEIISIADVATSAVDADLNITSELFSTDAVAAVFTEPTPAPIEPRLYKEFPPVRFTRPVWTRGAAMYAGEKVGILKKIAKVGPSAGITQVVRSKLDEMMRDDGARPMLRHQTNAILLAVRSMFDANDTHVSARGCVLTLKPGAGKTTVAINLAQALRSCYAIDAAFAVVPPALVDTWIHEARVCSSKTFQVQPIEITKEGITSNPRTYATELVTQARTPATDPDVRTTTLFILRNSVLNAEPKSPDATKLHTVIHNICSRIRTAVFLDEVHLNHRDPTSNPSRNFIATFALPWMRYSPEIVAISANPIMNKEREYHAMLRTIGFQAPPGISLHKTTPTENAALLRSVTIDSAITEYNPYDQTPPHAVLLARVHPIKAEAEERITASLQQVTGVVKGDVILENMPKFAAAAKIAENVVKNTGRNVCIFVDYVKGLEAIAKSLEASGVKVVRIHGDIPQEERTRSLDEANREGAEPCVICATSGAGGTGLSMHLRCDLLIYVTMPWSIKVADQVSKRISRIRALSDPTRITNMVILQGDAEAEERIFNSAMERLDAFGSYYADDGKGMTTAEAELAPCGAEEITRLITAIYQFHRQTGKAIQATRHTRLIEAMSQCPADGTVTLEEAVATADIDADTVATLRSFMAPAAAA